MTVGLLVYMGSCKGSATMGAIGNFLWFVLGGVLLGLSWWLLGLLAFITIEGIPWGQSVFCHWAVCIFTFGHQQERFVRQCFSCRYRNLPLSLGSLPDGLKQRPLVCNCQPAAEPVGWTTTCSDPPSLAG